MEHPITPPAAETLEELGQKLARLRPDALIVVFQAVVKEMAVQRSVDEDAIRRMMSLCRPHLVRTLEHAIDVLERVLQESVQHMKEDLAKRPLLIELSSE